MVSAATSKTAGLVFKHPLKVPQQARFAAAAVAKYADESLMKPRAALSAKRKEVLSSDGWTACSYQGGSLLGDSSGVHQFSFKFESPRQSFGLQMGETLSLMAIDDQGKVQRADVIPSSRRSKVGSFDIVLNEGDQVSLFLQSQFMSKCPPYPPFRPPKCKRVIFSFVSFVSPRTIWKPVRSRRCLLGWSRETRSQSKLGPISLRPFVARWMSPSHSFTAS